jgi:transcription antitermination factor NusG
MYPWHVLRVRSSFELSVAVALGISSDFIGFAPMYREEITRVVKPLLPGYVFARFETHSAVAWHRVREVHHVLGFITEDDMWPAPVLDPVVDNWFAAVDADGIVPLEARRSDVLRGFGAGDTLTITDGALAGHSGLCLWVDQRGARIEVALLGRTVGLYVALTSVIPAQDASEVSVAAGLSASKARRMRRNKRIFLRRAAPLAVNL